MKDKRVILYDGYCNLCSRAVRWVKRNDRKGRFSFQPLSGQPAPEPFSEKHAPEQSSPKKPASEKSASEKSDPVVDSVVLLQNGKRYERSAAAIRIAMGLRFPWPLLAILLIVPPFARDAVYDVVARNRTRWFGTRSSCYIPED
ncbi:MAG: DCC1-like thiol-disulfide oxidoreductase family protein [Bacteroidales bacterium]